ncbi:MAG: type I DNA topoisomerase, partial [Kiritimatiellia bacterium]|nr:type I DNA topoisomerase [Kiritimatiellia bacterium]
MATGLVIVESPAKAKTINRILGKDFVVKASMGHIRDLPQRKLGVDIEHGFAPEYVTLKGREKVVRELKEASKKVKDIYLAPDPDREGESIAWHLQQILKGAVPPENFHRITYHEITPSAIRKALQNPSRIDENKVNSQQARRILDRLVGYRVSPLLWRRIRGASSAGRVQSVALRLVCEREREILAFEPREYWLLGARVGKKVDPRDPFDIRLTRIGGEKAEIASGAQAQTVRSDLEGRALRVASIQTREVSRRPFPPYITSTLQQAGSRFCGFTPARTMRLAQSLYEGQDLGEGPVGLITYMRTDSVSIAREAQESCRAFVTETMGPDYVPATPNVYRSRSGAQEAHEAIRPTDVRRTPESLREILPADELKLYRVIWQRFVASQMSPARIAQRLVEVEAVPPSASSQTYAFRASASEILFPGYMKVLEIDVPPKSESKEADEAEVEHLPPLTEGEFLDLREWLSEQKFTQPPPRFSEASLVKALEEHGIGRPSTYAQTLSTLVDRLYVEKEKRQLKPSTLGLSTNDFLVAHLDALFNVGFTADMENKLDLVESGEVDWTDMLKTFHGQFLQWVEAAKGPPADPEEARKVLASLAQVQNWAPASGTGRTKRDDRAFVESVREQAEEGTKALSDRQLSALKSLAARYADQVPELAAFASAPNADGTIAAAPREVTEAVRSKIALLEGAPFNPPRKIGKRTFDDAKFFRSLADQVAAGRGLSENQERVLNRMIGKYREKITDFETRSAGLEYGVEESDSDHP